MKEEKLINVLHLDLKFDIQKGLLQADMEANSAFFSEENITEMQKDFNTIGQKIYDFWLEEGKIKKRNKKPWEILRIDNLALCYKTFIGKEASEKDIEICAFNDDDTRYTIASFDYNEKEDCYILKCCDKLNDEKIDWQVFGDLVLEGYKILDE